MKWLHASFWVPYEGTEYPTVSKAQAAISAYCQKNGHTCRFLGDDQVEIAVVPHALYSGYEPGSRVNSGIKFRKMT